MPRTAAKTNQADIARALRAVKIVTGKEAEVVFETDGRVRVRPVAEGEEPRRVDPEEDFDL